MIETYSEIGLRGTIWSTGPNRYFPGFYDASSGYVLIDQEILDAVRAEGIQAIPSATYRHLWVVPYVTPDALSLGQSVRFQHDYHLTFDDAVNAHERALVTYVDPATGAVELTLDNYHHSLACQGNSLLVKPLIADDVLVYLVDHKREEGVARKERRPVVTHCFALQH